VREKALGKQSGQKIQEIAGSHDVGTRKKRSGNRREQVTKEASTETDLKVESLKVGGRGKPSQTLEKRPRRRSQLKFYKENEIESLSRF